LMLQHQQTCMMQWPESKRRSPRASCLQNKDIVNLFGMILAQRQTCGFVDVKIRMLRSRLWRLFIRCFLLCRYLHYM
jgi:hypothetical protein